MGYLLSVTRENSLAVYPRNSPQTDDIHPHLTLELLGLDGSHRAKIRLVWAETSKMWLLDTEGSLSPIQGSCLATPTTCKEKATSSHIYPAMRSIWKHIVWAMYTLTLPAMYGLSLLGLVI